MSALIKKLMMFLAIIGSIVSATAMESNRSPVPLSPTHPPSVLGAVSLETHHTLASLEISSRIKRPGDLGRGRASGDAGNSLGLGLAAQQKTVVLASVIRPDLANEPLALREEAALQANEAAAPDAWTLLFCGLAIGALIARHRLSGTAHDPV
jgi:hypothetical protein